MIRAHYFNFDIRFWPISALMLKTLHRIKFDDRYFQCLCVYDRICDSASSKFDLFGSPWKKTSLDPPIQVIQDCLEAEPERLSKAEKTSPRFLCDLKFQRPLFSFAPTIEQISRKATSIQCYKTFFHKRLEWGLGFGLFDQVDQKKAASVIIKGILKKRATSTSGRNAKRKFMRLYLLTIQDGCILLGCPLNKNLMWRPCLRKKIE